MSGVLLGLLAETPVHVGTGRALGVVDLPVAREGATGYPFVPGSGMKGALRDRARRVLDAEQVVGLFGDVDGAGAVLVGDARLVLLPVRSLDGPYRWLTAPYLLERLHRDALRVGIGLTFGTLPRPEAGTVVVAIDEVGDDPFTYLEDQRYERVPGHLDTIVEVLGSLLGHEAARARLPRQLGIVADDDFAWFAQNALPVVARNVLDEETKQSENLWYEESLPPDTVFYQVLLPRSSVDLGEVCETLFATNPYLQVGGNETIGHGWLHVTVRRT